jgi:hypothetical protein
VYVFWGGNPPCFGPCRVAHLYLSALQLFWVPPEFHASCAQAEMPGKDTHIKVSLRSINGFDTSAVTSAFGGGGHAAASSCLLPLAELEAWQDMASTTGK